LEAWSPFKLINEDITLIDMTDQVEEVPYWKNYQVNVVRGVIAAICCAVFFIGIGLVHKFRWRPEVGSKAQSTLDMDDLTRPAKGHTRKRHLDGVDNAACASPSDE